MGDKKKKSSRTATTFVSATLIFNIKGVLN
jgi:hypothetical protein